MLGFQYWIMIIILLSVIFLFWQLFMNKSPEPKYKSLQIAGDIETRLYPPILVAQVVMQGNRSSAINDGFKILADYIFGNNTQQQKISMTAPVKQQGVSIPMTAPVRQIQQGNAWIVEFVMPENFTKETLPKPVNQSISIIEIPAKEVVVIRFSGDSSQNNLDDHASRLKKHIDKNSLQIVEPPIYAFYNPPWILPLFRRTEIMFELRKSIS